MSNATGLRADTVHSIALLCLAPVVVNMLAFAHVFQTWWLLQHVPTGIFVFCFGACVGSFLNVVIYRLPLGMSVTTPPSRCMTCGAKLRFFRENLPIIGWFAVRGRCRYCGVSISPQYMIVELTMALAFLGLYIIFYAIPHYSGYWGQIGGAWWYTNTIVRTWPAYLIYAFLIAALVAMTVIDARTFTIPIQIPLFVTFTAFLAWPLQALLPLLHTPNQSWPIPTVGWTGAAMCAGGMLGVVISWLLLRAGKLRYSFADYHHYVKEGEILGDYPHARREMMIEIIYLSPCILGLIAGYWLMRWFSPTGVPPVFVQATCAPLAGYLVGGGLIWGIRILGSLAFGREAMGLGDVHLLAAVGAVLGWFDPILIFFLAPFSGLGWAFVSMGIASLFRKARRELPYGPHLAVATLVVMLCRPTINQGWTLFMPAVPMPKQGLITAASPASSSSTSQPATGNQP